MRYVGFNNGQICRHGETRKYASNLVAQKKQQHSRMKNIQRISIG